MLIGPEGVFFIEMVTMLVTEDVAEIKKKIKKNIPNINHRAECRNETIFVPCWIQSIQNKSSIQIKT